MLSVVINTRNEIRHIAGCIASVRALADEIVVCDMLSTDGTADAARRLGARVIEHPVCPFVEPARYQAISAARGDWILVIDADERLTPSLEKRLRQVMVEGRHPAVSIAFLTQFAGHWLRHGPTAHLRVVRFFRQQSYFDTFREQELQIHENFKAMRALPNLLELDLSTPMLHLAYPSLEGLTLKQLQYAAEDALKRFENRERGSYLRLFRRIVERARKALIRQNAWKDGLPGWLFTGILCLNESVSSLRLMELQAAAAAGQPPLPEMPAAGFTPPPGLASSPPPLEIAAAPTAGLPTVTPG